MRGYAHVPAKMWLKESSTNPLLGLEVSVLETLGNGNSAFFEAASAGHSKVQEFDVFLSHTWHTKGIWKFLSLSLQLTWIHILLCAPAAAKTFSEKMTPN